MCVEWFQEKKGARNVKRIIITVFFSTFPIHRFVIIGNFERATFASKRWAYFQYFAIFCKKERKEERKKTMFFLFIYSKFTLKTVLLSLFEINIFFFSSNSLSVRICIYPKNSPHYLCFLLATVTQR